MMGERWVMQEALFYGFSSSGMSRIPGAPPHHFEGAWLASSLRRLLRSGEESAFDQRRLTSQPCDLTVC
jgi:hypothetical protein